MDQNTRKLWYTLARCRGVDAATLRKIQHTSIPQILRDPRWELEHKRYRDEYEYLHKGSANFILATDSCYPESLYQLSDAPAILWYRGDINLLKLPQIGMVGARNASLNTQNFVAKITRTLGEKGYSITSGFARGIDAAAHAAACETGTIAVLGCGVDIVYPQQNTYLFDKILAARGLIISEFPLGTPPRAQNFPRRNRIIAALSQAIVIAEAGARSGSLITARLGNELGKDIYVIPGFPEDPRFTGSIDLLKQGATPLSCVEDIIDNAFLPYPKIRKNSEPLTDELSPEHRSFLELLSFTPTPIDDLVGKCQTSMDVLGQMISELELAGKVLRTHDNGLILTHE